MVSGFWPYVSNNLHALLLAGVLGFLLGGLVFFALFGKRHKKNLTTEGEGALRSEAVVDTAVANQAGKDTTVSEDETYALEWRNRYLAARVKYLEGRLAETEQTRRHGQVE
ncbi:MAG: hypothetical protein GDA39_08895 [Hyphomonadaceae bacterium]|nr:hypothetical protein [Hyphomonadaceae bacterium]MBC6412965.1 hypothetical protein [Hyphomonadaceae bacterium]